VHVSSNILKTRETCGSSIGRREECCLLGSDTSLSGGCVQTFQRILFLPMSTTVMKVADPSQTSMCFYQSIRGLFPEDSNVRPISKLKNVGEHEILNCYSGKNLGKKRMK
jgi:hypothetical protein